MSVRREEVSWDADMDDGAIVFALERSQTGSLTAKVRVYAHFSVNGVEYEIDQEVRVKAKKRTKKGN